MTGTAGPVQIHRSEGTSTKRALGLSVLLGVLGGAVVAGAWFALSARLPANLPDHFGPGGEADGWVSGPEFLAGELAILAGLTALFAVLLVLTGRSRPLSHQFGSGFVVPLLVVEAAVVTVSVPLTAVIVLARAAGAWTITPGLLGLTLVAVGLIPLVAALVAVWPAVRRSRSGLGESIGTRVAPLPSPRASVRFGVGAPVEMLCSACAEPFVLSATPLFAPHMGFAGKGSLYVTCPRCGERSWDQVVRRLPA